MAKSLRANVISHKAFDPAIASLGLIEHFPIHTARGAVIGAIWPLAGEIDPRLLMYELSDHGHEIALPCTPRKGQPLTFRQWHPKDTLKPGPYSTFEPFPSKPEVYPDFVLVPLLGFTQTGARLGYGGGFYDRTLAKLRTKLTQCFAWGVAYAGQEMETLPIDEYDIPLDAILTDKYYRTF